MKDRQNERQSRMNFIGVGAVRVRIFRMLFLRLSRLGLFVELCGGGGGGGWIVDVRRHLGPGSGVRLTACAEDRDGCILEGGRAP